MTAAATEGALSRSLLWCCCGPGVRIGRWGTKSNEVKEVALWLS